MSNEAIVQPMHTNVIVVIKDNKHRKTKSAGGILLPENTLTFSQETGQLEEALEKVINYAEVINVGAECKYLKPGFGVYVDSRGLRPIPFMGKEYMQVDERNVLCYIIE